MTMAGPRETATAVRAHAIELLVFLFLIVPSLLLSLSPAAQAGPGNGEPFVLVAAATILRDLALVALVLFFVWRNAEPLAHIGWAARHPLREVALGLVLFVPTTVAASLLDLALLRLGLTSPAHQPAGLTPSAGQMPLAVLLVLVVAVAEETLFRGYVLGRLRECTRSTTLALALTTVIFAVGHGYEGSAGVVSVGFLGLIFGLVFLWRGSLVAPITMHLSQDVIAILVLPWLARGAAWGRALG